MTHQPWIEHSAGGNRARTGDACPRAGWAALPLGPGITNHRESNSHKSRHTDFHVAVSGVHSVGAIRFVPEASAAFVRPDRLFFNLPCPMDKFTV